jgi:hypothetical protein
MQLSLMATRSLALWNAATRAAKASSQPAMDSGICRGMFFRSRLTFTARAMHFGRVEGF